MQTKTEKNNRFSDVRIPTAADFMPRGEAELTILRERAEHLAIRSIDIAAKHNQVTYICFCLGKNDQYGIPYQYTTELISHVKFTNVPWTPPFIAGALNRRGALIAILDLKQLFYNQATLHNQDAYIIFVTANNITVGILADSIIGSRDYDPITLHAPLSSTGILKPEFILGLHQGVTAIINIETILADSILQIKKLITT